MKTHSSVFLDALADAKLLETRVTPPGSGDMASFVLSDGTMADGIVETVRTPASLAKLKLGEAQVSEAAAKTVRRPLREREATEKAQARTRDESQPRQASDARGVEETLHQRRTAQGLGPLAHKLRRSRLRLATLKQRAEALAKRESAVRKHSEQEMKEHYRTAALPVRKCSHRARASARSPRSTRRRFRDPRFVGS